MGIHGYPDRGGSCQMAMVRNTKHPTVAPRSNDSGALRFWPQKPQYLTVKSQSNCRSPQDNTLTLPIYVSYNLSDWNTLLGKDTYFSQWCLQTVQMRIRCPVVRILQHMHETQITVRTSTLNVQGLG